MALSWWAIPSCKDVFWSALTKCCHLQNEVKVRSAWWTKDKSCLNHYYSESTAAIEITWPQDHVSWTPCDMVALGLWPIRYGESLNINFPKLHLNYMNHLLELTGITRVSPLSNVIDFMYLSICRYRIKFFYLHYRYILHLMHHHLHL